MRSSGVNHFSVGPRLKIIFVLLIALILGGNGLLVWQFHIARLENNSLSGLSQQLVAVLRLQQGLLSFHQRLDELARSKDGDRLVTEAEPLRINLVERTELTRDVLSHLSSEALVDPAFLPTLESIEVTLPSQLEAITDLATSGDWETVNLRLDNELKPVETLTSSLVENIDRELNKELPKADANTKKVQDRILVLVPITAIATFFVAALFGWSIARQMIELRFDERLAERTRLARDLHDTFIQTIQGSKLVADDALDASDDPARMRRAMVQLSGWLGQAMQEGRAALDSLRTSTTEANDLAQGLQRATKEGLVPGSMGVGFSVIGVPKEMHPIVRDEVFQIGNEAIRNASVHSKATRLDVELNYGQDLILRVIDNGIGIDSAITQCGKEGHFGLQGMQERAARIGGKLSILTSAKSGTEIRLTVSGGVIFRK